MKTLAIEFSCDQRSVAIAEDGRVLGTASEQATRATHAFALIEYALAEAKLQREQVDSITVGLGPGSYTGIRSALALAQGWQLARSIHLLGISSVECLAAEARAQGWLGMANIVIDAQRNELYFARYLVTATDLKELSPLKLATVDAVRAECGPGEFIIGPEVTRWFAEGKVAYPNASTLAGLAAGRTDFVPGEKLEPIYLRETNFVKAPPPRIL